MVASKFKKLASRFASNATTGSNEVETNEQIIPSTPKGGSRLANGFNRLRERLNTGGRRNTANSTGTALSMAAAAAAAAAAVTAKSSEPTSTMVEVMDGEDSEDSIPTAERRSSASSLPKRRPSKERPQRRTIGNTGEVGEGVVDDFITRAIDRRQIDLEKYAGSGADWIARTLNEETVISKQKECSNALYDAWEDLWVSEGCPRISHSIMRHMKERTNREMDAVLHCVAKRGFHEIRDTVAERNMLREQGAETELKMTEMQNKFVKEITTLRDKVRPSVADTVREAEAAVQGELVTFYEPLQYLKDDQRGMVMSIVDEKLKAIFAYDEKCRDLTNRKELQNFEHQMRDERLIAYEKLQKKMVDENRSQEKTLKELRAKIDHYEMENRDLSRDLHGIKAKSIKADEKTTTLMAELEELKSKAAQVVNLKGDLAGVTEELEQVKQKEKEAQEALQGSDQCWRQVVDDLNAQLAKLRKENQARMNAMANEMMENLDLDSKIEERKKKEEEDAFKVALAATERERAKVKDELQQAHSEITLLQQQLAEAEKGEARAKAEAKQLLKQADESAGSREQKLKEDLEQKEAELQKVKEDLDDALNEIETAKLLYRRGHSDAEHKSNEVAQLKASIEVLRLEGRQQADELNSAQQQIMLLTDSIDASDSAKKTASAEVSNLVKENSKLLKALEEVKAELEMARVSCAELEAQNALRLLENPEPAPETLPKATEKPPPEAAPEPAPPRKNSKTESVAAARASMAQEYKQGKIQADKGAKLKQKVKMATEQLRAMTDENTGLRIALQSMQTDIKDMAKTLQECAPRVSAADTGSESSGNENLQKVQKRMSQMGKSGVGSYLRLYKEVKQRLAAASKDSIDEDSDDFDSERESPERYARMVKSPFSEESTNSKSSKVPAAASAKSPVNEDSAKGQTSKGITHFGFDDQASGVVPRYRNPPNAARKPKAPPMSMAQPGLAESINSEGNTQRQRTNSTEVSSSKTLTQELNLVSPSYPRRGSGSNLQVAPSKK